MTLSANDSLWSPLFLKKRVSTTVESTYSIPKYPDDIEQIIFIIFTSNAAVQQK